MYPARLLICFFIGAIWPALRAKAFQKQQPDYVRWYTQAEKLSNAEKPTDETDRQALLTYNKVISKLSASGLNNAFLFKTYVSTGVFLQVLNKPKAAITYFKQAINLKQRMPPGSDSVLFKPMVYCGNSYYQLDLLDSARLAYDKGRLIAEKYPHINEVERLYNTLGVMAYSSGNYTKSIAYYEKAIATLAGRPASDNLLLVSYKSNLASAYRRLKMYQKSLELYLQILPYHTETDKLLHNIGSLYLAMGQNAQAIKYLQQVKYHDQRKLNDLGKAYMAQADYNTAYSYLQQAINLNQKNNNGRKNSDNGITLKYLGDFWVRQNQVLKGIRFYQQAIGNLLLDFKAADIYASPNNFNMVFNIEELMDAILAKAVAFNLLYQQNHNLKNLDASLQTYLTFYKLADHIERFYESDEARLVISNRKYASRQQPIAICLQLYKLTNNRQYIADAFLLDEENKANTLSLNLQEAKLKLNSGISPALLKQETDLKESITRTSLKAAGEADTATLLRLKKNINDYTIQLLSVQQKIKPGMGSGNSTFAYTDFSIEALQKRIPPESVILSYHLGTRDLLCFIVTNSSFDFFSTPLATSFYPALKDLNTQAQVRTGNNTRIIRKLGAQLYQALIKRAENQLSGAKNLMIIPDDELNYLPFDILTDEEDETLLKRFNITYNYSCTILQNSNNSPAGDIKANLAMAPFANTLLGAATQLTQLPASKQEIENIAGMTLFNGKATKKKFIADAGKYNIIHLATHAYANDVNPDVSYIAFYPSVPDSALTFKLYQPEIYNLKLDKTRLVVLSACESGAGQLVKGEGVMSLSRAFSYAGCNNIITSMWKADDASTAYLSQKLHQYLNNGYTISEALTKAKLDYLNDDKILSAKKLPGYWAHLRLIGNFEDSRNKPAYLYWLIALAVTGGILLIKNRERLTRSRLKNRG